MKRLLLVVLVTLSYIGYGQNGTLQGTISSKGQPISFATISVKGNGKQTGTSADINGKYSIELSQGTYNVVISAVGYRNKKQEVSIQSGKTTTLDANLQEDMLGLDQVVVTGSRSEVPLYKAPVVVNKISAKTLDMTQSLSISEGLNFSPGLRMETNCQNCGFNQLRINGLDGAYSQILINSRPVFSALAGVYGLEMIPANMVDRIEVVKGGGSALYGGNAIGGTVNIITKDPNESTFQAGTNLSFIKGKTPDRTLFLNGAIVSEGLDKGMSFFAYNRDRQPFDANGDGFSEMTKLKNNTFGADFFWNTSERSKLKLDFNSITEFRRGGDRFNYEPHESGITEQLQHRILGGDLSFEIFSNDFKHKFTVYTSAQNTDRNSYYGGGGETVRSLTNILDMMKDVTYDGVTYNVKDKVKSLIASGEELTEKKINEWIKSKSLATYNDEEKREELAKKIIESKDTFFTALNAYGQSHDISSATGIQYVYNINDDINLSLGSEYQYNHVTDEMPGYNRSINQKVATLGNYAQLEWNVKPFTFLVGGRYDYAKLDGIYKFSSATEQKINRSFSNFVPRLTLKYDLSEHWKLRASYAQGYRIPQAFDEDLHVASVSGETLFTRLSPNLKPEKSDNITASINYVKSMGDWQANIVLESFYTHLKNPFRFKRNADGEEYEDTTSMPGVTIKEKVNAEGATVKGVNFETNLAYLDKFIFQMGATFQSSSYEKPEILLVKKNGEKISTKKILRSPDTYGFFAATYNPSEAWSFTYSGVLTGSMDVFHEGNEEIVKTPVFFENNLKGSYKFETSDHYFVQLSAGIQNIFDSYQNDFDKGPDRDSTYIYGPVRPRTFFLGLKFGLD